MHLEEGKLIRIVFDGGCFTGKFVRPDEIGFSIEGAEKSVSVPWSALETGEAQLADPIVKVNSPENDQDSAEQAA